MIVFTNYCTHMDVYMLIACSNPIVAHIVFCHPIFFSNRPCHIPLKYKVGVPYSLAYHNQTFIFNWISSHVKLQEQIPNIHVFKTY